MPVSNTYKIQFVYSISNMQLRGIVTFPVDLRLFGFLK